MIGNQLNELLKNLIDSAENILLVAIIDQEGLPVASSTRSDEEYIIAAVTSQFDKFRQRMEKEFGSRNNIVSNFTFIDNYKFFFTDAGQNSTLTIVCTKDSSENVIKVYGKFVAEKVKRILERHEDVSTTIPRNLKAIALFPDGKLPKGNFTKKLIMCGDNEVGKTSLVRRFIDKSFKESYKPTLGIDILEKNITLDEDCIVNFLIWDIDGQIQNMLPYRKKFYKGAGGAFLIFDRTQKTTFQSMKFWLKDINELEKDGIPTILLGNKNDLKTYSNVSSEEIDSFSHAENLEFVETSAKTGENVDEVFTYMALKILGMDFSA